MYLSDLVRSCQDGLRRWASEGQRSDEGDLESLERTEYIEADLESVLAGSIASDTRVESCVWEASWVDDERTDALFIDHDLV